MEPAEWSREFLQKEAQLQTTAYEAGMFLLTVFIHHKLVLDVTLNSDQLKINDANKETSHITSVHFVSGTIYDPEIFFFMA